MADVHSKPTRSYNMSQIHGKDTKPEILVRHYLFSKGFRYRKNDSRLPGKPDVVLPKYKTAVFVNGCFWHKHEGCKYFKWPESNEEFWRNKIEQTVLRDKKIISELEQRGWKVIVLWECQLRGEKTAKTLEQLENEIRRIH